MPALVSGQVRIRFPCVRTRTVVGDNDCGCWLACGCLAMWPTQPAYLDSMSDRFQPFWWGHKRRWPAAGGFAAPGSVVWLRSAQQRVCQLCRQGVGDEFQVVFECSGQDIPRSRHARLFDQFGCHEAVCGPEPALGGVFHKMHVNGGPRSSPLTVCCVVILLKALMRPLRNA